MRVNATDLQNSFGKYLALAEKENIIITKNGRNVARLVGYNPPGYFVVHDESSKYQTSKKISYEEYTTLVKSSDQRYELIDGEIYLLASSSFYHQVIVNELAWHFSSYFRERPCRSLTAPLEVRLFAFALEKEPNVVQPDIIVICDEDRINEENKYEGIPSLVVEVVSPATKGKDMITKPNLYMKSGILEYWIVNPENKTITQYTFTGNRKLKNIKEYGRNEKICSSVFENLEIPLQAIFESIK